MRAGAIQNSQGKGLRTAAQGEPGRGRADTAGQGV
jgi:hypothetical protein